MAETRAERTEMRFSGSGGQGILLAATIVAEAATALGRHVVQTQSYGPEARGGASKAEVIVSSDEIDYPEVAAPGISLCMSQSAYRKYGRDTEVGGLLLYDSGLVEPEAGMDGRILVGLPFAQAATEQLDKAVVANIVALGALAEVSEMLPADAVEEAVVNRVPVQFRELNARAFRLGRRLARER